jgi:hypothetical protein
MASSQSYSPLVVATRGAYTQPYTFDSLLYRKTTHYLYEPNWHSFLACATSRHQIYPPPLVLPLITISNEECHPNRDISTTQPTITTIHNQANIYQDNGKYLLTIPITRLQWLWQQYHSVQQHPQFLEPPLQPFETEVMWLYQRYNYRVSRKNPTDTLHYTFPIPLQFFLHTTFNITHSYFSSPITCSTTLTKFFSPVPRDIVFGSLGNAFQHKWMGSGYTHSNHPKDF